MTLFDDASDGAGTGVPAGLVMVDGYLSATEHDRLVAFADSLDWSTRFASRRTVCFGVDYDARSGSVSAGRRPLHGPVLDLADRLLDDGWFPRRPDAALFNDYRNRVCADGTTALASIAAHIDAPAFGEPVAIVSLGDTWSMAFDRGRGTPAVEVPLPVRSLVLLTGDSRWRHRHAIRSRRVEHDAGLGTRQRRRRLSLTFRVLLDGGGSNDDRPVPI